MAHECDGRQDRQTDGHNCVAYLRFYAVRRAIKALMCCRW